MRLHYHNEKGETRHKTLRFVFYDADAITRSFHEVNGGNGGGNMTTKPQVLLVDDEPMVLDALRELVNREGKFDIDVAENGAIALAKALQEEYSVIITDLMLKDITGIDLLKSLKASTPDTQIIMISGKGTIDFAVEAMKVGAFDFITKPYSPPHLLQILERARAYNDSLKENKTLKGEIQRLKKNYEII